jgi:hypothetical protein
MKTDMITDVPWHIRFELRFDPKFGKDQEEITGRIYVEVPHAATGVPRP